MSAMPSRKGLTWIEVLVVLMIVTVLVALLLPAVQTSGGGARRSQCKYNLQQLGLAAHNYHDAHGRFPPAYTVTGTGSLTRMDPENWHASGLTYLLPYIDQQELAARYDLERPIAWPSNLDVISTRIEAFVCPTETATHRTILYFEGKNCAAAAYNGLRGALGNYAVNIGPNYIRDRHDISGRALGVAGVNTCFRREDFRDGLSNTVFLDEIRAGTSPTLDARGCWGLPGIGSSAIAGQASTDVLGPNFQFAHADDLQACDTTADDPSGVMGCNNNWHAGNVQATSRSWHKGGVQVLLSDGSARFIINDVDPAVWNGLHTRSGDEPLPDF